MPAPPGAPILEGLACGRYAVARRGSAPYVLLLRWSRASSAASQAAAAPVADRSQKQAEAQQVIGQINELNASLDRADELVNLANLKLAQVKHDIAVNRRELVIAQAQPGAEPADDREPPRQALHDAGRPRPST